MPAPAMGGRMSNRMMEIGVAALTSLALIAVYLVARAHLGEATDGDWLNFAGSVFGVMGAILIALWLPHIQARNRDRIAKARIIETARPLISALDFSDVPNIDQAGGRWEGVRVALERMAFERERIDNITHAQFHRLRGIERVLQRMDDRIVQNPELLDPLAFEFELGAERNGVVNWLGQLETMLKD